MRRDSHDKNESKSRRVRNREILYRLSTLPAVPKFSDDHAVDSDDAPKNADEGDVPPSSEGEPDAKEPSSSTTLDKAVEVSGPEAAAISTDIPSTDTIVEDAACSENAASVEPVNPCSSGDSIFGTDAGAVSIFGSSSSKSAFAESGDGNNAAGSIFGIGSSSSSG